MQAPESLPQKTVAGRYTLFGAIGAGGMATVHLARRLTAPGGVVAVKRVHPHLAHDPDLSAMFVDEARIAARIVHPNVVPTLEVVVEAGELFLVMEHVTGESLARLVGAATARNKPIPLAVASAVVVGVLRGLEAAHRATDERGALLHVIHRDVSPQNVIVGVDGVPRLLDFGIAKASGRSRTTKEGQLRGKLAYMAPEQLGGQASVATDVYAAAVMLWEVLTGRPLYEADSDAALLARVVIGDAQPPSAHRGDVPAALDLVVMRGLEKDPGARYESALAMARALESAMPVASQREVAAWLTEAAPEALLAREALLRELESTSPATTVGPASSGATSIAPPPSSLESGAARARSRGSRLVAVSLLTVAIASGGVAAVRRSSHAWPFASVASVASVAPASSAASVVSAPAETAAVASAMVPDPRAGQPASAGVQPPPSSAVAQLSSPPRVVRPKSTAATAASNGSSVSCDPPFVIDEKSGDWRYKRECLK